MNSHVIWLILPIKIVTDIRGKRINILIYRLILFRVRLVKLRKKSLLKSRIWHWNHYNIYWIVI